MPKQIVMRSVGGILPTHSAIWCDRAAAVYCICRVAPAHKRWYTVLVSPKVSPKSGDLAASQSVQWTELRARERSNCYSPTERYPMTRKTDRRVRPTGTLARPSRRSLLASIAYVGLGAATARAQSSGNWWDGLPGFGRGSSVREGSYAV